MVMLRDLGSNKTLLKDQHLKIKIESENGTLKIEIEKFVAIDVSFEN